MTYVTVKTDTKDRLHLRRDPSIRAWAILVALIACGFGAAFYSGDYLVWKLAYISGAVFVGLSCMEDWEDCILDKVCGTVTLQRKSLVQKLFQATTGHKIVVDQLENIVGVHVREEESEGNPKCYCVMLNFSAGFSLPVTETATTDDSSIHEQVAKKIRNFLQLPETPDYTANVPLMQTTPTGEGDTSSSSDEGFERIDRAELVDDDLIEDTQAAAEKDQSEDQE